jgi:nifR3 family TIM-barrel protein
MAGGIVLANRAVLAPMSGVSDLPFRVLAHRLGAGLVVSEMVASSELVRQRPDVVRRTQQGGVKPFVVQLAGCEARWMAEGARLAQGLGADIIDINMGCPARMVTGKLSGSALMRDLDHALCLIEATVRAVNVPVSLKMRLGWDEHSRNAGELARRAEAAGIRLISVHGRTRNQFFKGKANWSAIREVKSVVSIPVIANGDVATIEDARSMLAISGADGVMIGRGAYGAPWLPGRIGAALAAGSGVSDPSLAEQGEIVVGHYEHMLSHYGRELGAKNARKHLGWYTARAFGEEAKRWRVRLCTETEPGRVVRLLRGLYQSLEPRGAVA